MKFNSKKFFQILPLIFLCGSNVQALTTSKTLPSRSTTFKYSLKKSTSRILTTTRTKKMIGYPTDVGTVSYTRKGCTNPYYNTAKKRDFQSDLLGANSANIQNSLKEKREVYGGWGNSQKGDITDSEFALCNDYKTHLEFLDKSHNTKICFSTCLTGCPEGTTFNKYTGECLNSSEVDEEGWLKKPKCKKGVPAKYIEEYDRKCSSIGGRLGVYNNDPLSLEGITLSNNCIENATNIYCALCGLELSTERFFLFESERNYCKSENLSKEEYLEEVKERCAKIGGKISLNHSYTYDCILPVVITTKTLPITTKILPISKTTTSTKTLPISETTTSTKTLPISKTTTTTKTLPISKTTTTTKTLPISKTTTTTKTLPISKTTTTTKTLPISKTTTTTKTLPISETTTSTKTLPISKTTTSTKTIPISKTTTTTKTIPISKTTTSTKTIPISKTTTTTKTIPISKTTTSTKTLPISKTTTSTKTLPISTTKPTKCIPVTVTVTEKETITKKETVTVTVKSNPTSTEDDHKCAAKYEQCGGINFNGPTCCQSGSTCHELNQYYSQCM